MKSERWTDNDLARALKMRADGAPVEKIAAAIGRTAKAVKEKLSSLSMTQEKRAKRNEYERGRRERDNKTLSRIAGVTFEAHKARIPESVIAERDIRACASHRDFTAAFFGDPPRGYSALDRRGQA